MALHLATLKRILPNSGWLSFSVKKKLLQWARDHQICGPLKLLHNPSIRNLCSWFFCCFPPHVTKTPLTFSFISCNFVHTFCPFAITFFISYFIPRFSFSPYHFYILSSSSIHFLFLLFSRVFFNFSVNIFSILLFCC